MTVIPSALPPSLDLVQVTGRWVLIDGTPVHWGTVTLVPSVPRLVAAPDDTVVLASPIVLRVGPDGTVSGMVPATDDPDIIPVGWYYQVSVQLNNGTCTWGYGFDLQVPHDGGPVDLTEVTPPGPPPDPPVLCVLSVNGQTGHVTIPVGEGAVSSVNGQVGDVVLDAGDVNAVPAETVGEPGGVAGLGPDGKVPADQLPDIIGEPGPPGLSAYQVAVAEGFTGTETEWLTSLIGADGADGVDGASAYQVAVAQGYEGTQAEWLVSLVGPRGPEGPEGPQGEAGSGVRILGSLPDPDALPGSGNEVGDAYLIDGDLWVWDGAGWGNVGTIQGPQGEQGEAGADGLPVELRTTDTHVQWRYLDQDPWMDLVELDTITGPQGPQGEEGPQGETGPQGEQGVEGPQGEPGLDRLTTESITWPQIIGHRGAQAVCPENTAAGFDVALAAGTQILELDVHLAGDGALIINHDATLARTHGEDIQVRDLFAAAAPIHPVQPNLLGFPPVWEPQPMLTLDAVFARYWSAPVVWLIEIKAYSVAPAQVWEDTTRAVAQVVRRWGLEQATIIQSFNRDAGLAAIAEGFPAGYIETAGATSPAELLGEGFTFYGMRHDASEANLAAAVDSELRVLVYTVNRHVDRDRLLTAGADAVVTDDPTYMRLARTPSARDGFKAGTWPPGHLESPVVPVRGVLEEGGLMLAPPTLASGDPENFTSLVVGHLSPIPDPRQVTLSARVALLEADSLTRSAQIQLMVSDLGYDDNDHGRVDAYNVLLRASGAIDIYKAQGGSATQLATVSGPAPVVDPDSPTAMEVQVTVDGVGVRVRRTDVSPAVEVSAADTSLVAGYVGVGVRSVRAQFWDLTLG